MRITLSVILISSLFFGCSQENNSPNNTKVINVTPQIQTDSNTNTNIDSITDTDTDTDTDTYENKNLTQDEAFDLIYTNTRIINNRSAEISNKLEDWQIKNLAAYTLLAYDISQQVNNIATDNYDINIYDHTQLFRNILANKEMGFNNSHFDNIMYLDDICDVIDENDYNQFEIRENQFSDYINRANNLNKREVKVHTNIQLGECQFDYKEGEGIRKNLTHGGMTYEFDFINEVNSNTSQTLSAFQSKIHGKWLVSSETFGFEDSFGYYMLENFSSWTNYDNSKSQTDVITSELRSDIFIRDAYNNWDNRYFLRTNDTVIKKRIDSENPYEGSLELTNDIVGNSLVIEFSELTVDIYVNSELIFDDLSWSNLRETSLEL